MDEKNCPYCAEVIKAEAVFCRFCKTSLVAQPQPVVARPSGGGAVKWVVIGVVGFFLLVIVGAVAVPVLLATRRISREKRLRETHLPAVERRVTCDVRARTWRSGESPFDIRDEVARRLRDSGVEIGSSGADGHIEVDFEEFTGQEYTGTASGKSSVFSLELTVRSSGRDELAKIKYSTSTGFMIYAQPYSASISAFRDSSITKALGDIVGAALGIRACCPRIMPLACLSGVEEGVLRILNAQKYEPADGEGRATLAVARGDFDACVKIGKEAVDPLLGLFPRSSDERAAGIARALGEIGDRKAAEPLRSRLNSTWVSSSEEVLLVALVEVLGKLKDREALEKVRELEACKLEKVAAAAAIARELIER